MKAQVREDFAPFYPAGAPRLCHTWYRIYGDLATAELSSSTSTPLIVVHGGPAAGHESLLALEDLHTQYNIPLVFYDQIGANRSTHLDELAKDSSFWNPSLFVAELNNLVQHLGLTRYNVLGHSWGGILVSLWAGSTKPQGLEKLVISCTIASGSDRLAELDRLISEMPGDVRETLRKCQRGGDFASEDFRSALAPFLQKHVNRLLDKPGALKRVKNMTMNVGHVFKHL